MISVVLPVFNAERYLHESIRSVLAQTFKDFELIAVNDGSYDRSQAILEEYAKRDSRVRVIFRRNTGIVGALNDGLSASFGGLIARMDADDIAHPTRFERQLDYFSTHPDVVVCGTAVHFTDPFGRLVKPCPRPLSHDEIVSKLYEGDGGAMIHPSVMFRRESVLSIGGYREQAQWIEDLDLYLRLSECGKLANLPDYLLNYRQHPQSVNATKSDESRWVAKNAVLREALAKKGTQWVDRSFVPQQSTSELHCEWACESLGYGNWRVSLAHATRAVWAAPYDRRTWEVLKYVATYGRHVALKSRKRPSERYRVNVVENRASHD